MESCAACNLRVVNEDLGRRQQGAGPDAWRLMKGGLASAWRLTNGGLASAIFGWSTVIRGDDSGEPGRMHGGLRMEGRRLRFGKTSSWRRRKYVEQFHFVRGLASLHGSMRTWDMVHCGSHE